MAVLVFAGAANAQTAKPNIVVIMLADARLDDLAVMTKTNRIFSTGTAFANFYVPLAGAAPPERLTSPVSIPTTMECGRIIPLMADIRYFARPIPCRFSYKERDTTRA